MRKLQILAIALFCIVTFSAKAQMNIGATVGITLPMGDFGNGLETGFGFNAIGKYNLSDNMAIGASVGYSSFGTGSDNLSFGVIPVTGLLEFSFGSGALKPYIGADLGMYIFMTKFTFMGSSSSSTDAYFGLAPTGGIMFDITSNLSLIGNLKYNMVFSKDALDRSQTSSWLGINAGISLGIGK